MDWKRQERSLLHRCITDKVTMGNAVAALAGYRWVEKTTEWIWTTCREMFETVGEPPNTFLIKQAIENLPEKDQDDKLEELVEILRLPKELSPRAVIKSMQQRAMKLGTLEAMEAASEHFEKGDDKAGLLTMEKAMRSKVVRPGISVKPMFPKKFRVVKPLPRVPTGLFRLDQVIGGAQRGDVNYILGATGVGKSALSTEIAHSAIKTGHKVLYLDTENGEHVVQSRFYSRMTGIHYELLEQNRLGPENQERLQTWLDRNYERLEKQFKLAPLGAGVATMSQVEATIMEQIESGFRPDVVIFDSPDHLLMQGRGEAARWELFADIANQLKGVTERANVAMWATSQVGGDNIEAKIATTAHAADSKQKVRNAAIVVSINHRIDPKTGRPVPDTNARDLYLAKNRNGAGKFLIPLVCDLSRMHIGAPPEYKEPDPE